LWSGRGSDALREFRDVPVSKDLPVRTQRWHEQVYKALLDVVVRVSDMQLIKVRLPLST
jgi:hypothetical protein